MYEQTELAPQVRQWQAEGRWIDRGSWVRASKGLLRHPVYLGWLQRLFESVTLRWQKVSPRRRELASAEITPRFPFCLTVNTSIRTRCHHGRSAWYS